MTDLLIRIVRSVVVVSLVVAGVRLIAQEPKPFTPTRSLWWMRGRFEGRM